MVIMDGFGAGCFEQLRVGELSAQMLRLSSGPTSLVTTFGTAL
jgi:hypothetical protein